MPARHTHEIVLRGRIDRHVLGPFLDDFTVDLARPGSTRLLGRVRDPSHLHGLVAYLASINAELIAISPVGPTADHHDNDNDNDHDNDNDNDNDHDNDNDNDHDNRSNS